MDKKIKRQLEDLIDEVNMEDHEVFVIIKTKKPIDV